jgi:hypothetical protein
VEWNLGQLPRLREILKAAAASGEDLEVVLGSPPGWTDPWSRGERVRILESGKERLGGPDFVVELPETAEMFRLDEEEVFAVRRSPPDRDIPWPEGFDRVC